MESNRAEAIVLRRQPVTESSLVVTWFSREFGKVKTMAKGARRTKGPFTGKIDLFYQDEIVFLRSRRSDLHLLQDCFLVNAHRRLRENVGLVTAASYACELVDLATETEDPNAKIFDLLAATLGALGRRGSEVVLVWFEMQLLEAAGWAPKWETPSATSKVLASLAGAKLEGVGRVRLSVSQLEAARETLWRFWELHLGRLPQSRELLRRRINS